MKGFKRLFFILEGADNPQDADKSTKHHGNILILILTIFSACMT